MKNFILTLILLSPFSILTGMEEDGIVKEESFVTVVCADGQLEINTKTFEKLKKHSKVIKTFIGNSTQKNILSHPTITIEIFKKIISYLPKHSIYKKNSWVYSESEKKELIEKLMNENIETLIPLLKDCNELDMTILMNLLIEKVLPKKFIQYDKLEKFINDPEYIKKLNLPEDLSKAIASQIMNLTTIPQDFINKLYTKNTYNRMPVPGWSDGALHIEKIESKSKNGKWIANNINNQNNNDYIVRLYKIYNNEKNNIIFEEKSNPDNNYINDISFSNNNKLLASYRENGIRLYKLSDTEKPSLFVELNAMKGHHQGCLYKIYFKNDDKWLVSQNGRDKYWYNLDIFEFLNNLSLEHALLLKACFSKNKIVSLNKHTHLYAYFRQLPKLIQKSLIEQNMVKLSLLQTLNYHNQTIIQITVASTAIIITLFNVLKEK